MERLAHLAAFPLCARCLAEEPPRTTVATIVDHVLPHKGDMQLFWDRSNWQSLCKPCHDRKTGMEDGGLRPGRVAWHPGFLRRSVADLTIVCGAPGSGKSTWVAARALAGDVIIDVDVIGSEMCGTGLHDWHRRRLVDIGRERNRRLLMLSDWDMRGRKAWFIVSEPKPDWRQWWQDQLSPRRIVVIETQAFECIRRINADPTRTRTSGRMVEAWWRAYRRRQGDVVVGGG